MQVLQALTLSLREGLGSLIVTGAFILVGLVVGILVAETQRLEQWIRSIPVALTGRTSFGITEKVSEIAHGLQEVHGVGRNAQG